MVLVKGWIGNTSEGVDRKHWGFLFTAFIQDFKKVKGRVPKEDKDWWVEPMDDGIAICYIHEEKVRSK